MKMTLIDLGECFAQFKMNIKRQLLNPKLKFMLNFYWSYKHNVLVSYPFNLALKDTDYNRKGISL